MEKNSMCRTLLTGLRQLTYPREFRIIPTAWPADWVEQLEQLLYQASVPPAANQATESEPLRLLADVGTGLWRLRHRMVQPGTDQPLDEMRRAYRHFTSVWDALAEAGLSIRDHTREPVPEGGIYALRVIAFQPTPGLARETVIETIKPTIYYRDQLLQMGEVLVGTPAPLAEVTPTPLSGSQQENGA